LSIPTSAPEFREPLALAAVRLLYLCLSWSAKDPSFRWFEKGAHIVPLPAAASIALRPVLQGPERRGAVIAAYPVGCYIAVDAAPGILAFTGTAASRLPNAAVIAAPELPFRVRPGDAVRLGDGVISLCGNAIRIGRWFNPSPVLGSVDPARLARGLEALESIPLSGGIDDHPAVARLNAACRTGDPDRITEAGPPLVGLGPGLTPSGDDLLAGVLFGLRALGSIRIADALAAPVLAATARTTPISAALLHCAAAGLPCGEAAGLLLAVTADSDVPEAAERVRRLGHTSGADLARGLILACRTVLEGATAWPNSSS
jgi:hypothetical protein